MDNADSLLSLARRFINPSLGEPFEEAFNQVLARRDVSFFNVNVRVFYTAFFIALSAMMTKGPMGLEFDVSNLHVEFLVDHSVAHDVSTEINTEIGSSLSSPACTSSRFRIIFDNHIQKL